MGIPADSLELSGASIEYWCQAARWETLTTSDSVLCVPLLGFDYWEFAIWAFALTRLFLRGGRLPKPPSRSRPTFSVRCRNETVN